MLAKGEVWIRQGIKARRTRDEGRVRRLKAMRVERAQRREQVGNVRMDTAQAGASGKKVIQATDVSFSFGDRALVRDFSPNILRGNPTGLIEIGSAPGRDGRGQKGG